MLYESPAVEMSKIMVPRDQSDGSPPEIPLFVARPKGGRNRPGLLVIQEIFGVNVHIQEVAVRLAEQGYVAVAPDLFCRAGHWQTFDYTDVDGGRGQAGLLKPDLIMGDLTASMHYLSSLPEVDVSRLGITGYCMGGTISYLAAAHLPDRIKAAAIYYGGGIARQLQHAASIRCPVIGFFGALDKHIPREDVAKLDEALGAAGVNRQIFYYPKADHGFFCNHRASYGPLAAQDAWHRTLDFFNRHLGPFPSVDWE